jgi:hypothetical protein
LLLLLLLPLLFLLVIPVGNLLFVVAVAFRTTPNPYHPKTVILSEGFALFANTQPKDPEELDSPKSPEPFQPRTSPRFTPRRSKRATQQK